MASSVDDVLRQALELEEPERVRLVSALLSTLERGTSAKSLSDTEWIAEIERRAWAALAGGPTISWGEARKRIEDSFTRE